MPVNLKIPERDELVAVPGIELVTSMAAIRKANRRDVLIMRLAPGARAAGVFTLNRFCAAPVQVCREHLLASHGAIRALLVNTGCANAGTGERGLRDARASCEMVARELGCRPDEVLPFSTGVILEHLPMERLEAGIKSAIHSARQSDWLDAAEAIMTTDTQPKAVSRRLEVMGHAVSISGISKGAGMIRPNMATMLGYLATDAAIEQSLLERWVREIADRSFNRVTVDGDTSTNDSFMLIASGVSPLRLGAETDPGATELFSALLEAAQYLAQAIVRDGEGATKFITIDVEAARTSEEAAKVAYAIAHSPLVKTAFFASDPNLGRILAAVGYAGVSDLDVSGIDLYLGDVPVATRGGRHPDYREEDGQRIMREAEITVRVALGRGSSRTTVWTCDFSHDYVSINADYRS